MILKSQYHCHRHIQSLKQNCQHRRTLHFLQLFLEKILIKFLIVIYQGELTHNILTFKLF
jgi:hypothetical protein